MDEVWKEIKGYEGIYQASNLGNIRSVDRVDFAGNRVKGKVLKQSNNSKGYLKIGLTKYGKTKQFLVHRIIYQTFKGEIPKGYEINHKDYNRINNNIVNLEIMTRKENNDYSTVSGRKREFNIDQKGIRNRVLFNDGTYKDFKSLSLTAEYLGIGYNVISRIIKGRSSGKIIFKRYNIKSIEHLKAD